MQERERSGRGREWGRMSLHGGGLSICVALKEFSRVQSARHRVVAGRSRCLPWWPRARSLPHFAMSKTTLATVAAAAAAAAVCYWYYVHFHKKNTNAPPADAAAAPEKKMPASQTVLAGGADAAAAPPDFVERPPKKKLLGDGASVEQRPPRTVVGPPPMSKPVSGFLVAAEHAPDGFGGIIPEEGDGPPSTDSSDNEGDSSAGPSPSVSFINGKKSIREGSFRKRDDAKLERAKAIHAKSSSLTSHLVTPQIHNRRVRELEELKGWSQRNEKPPGKSVLGGTASTSTVLGAAKVASDMDRIKEWTPRGAPVAPVAPNTIATAARRLTGVSADEGKDGAAAPPPEASPHSSFKRRDSQVKRKDKLATLSSLASKS